jgi:UPF0716 family protein affecting phage T7 exclusion
MHRRVLRLGRRILIATSGLLVIAAGAAMLVLPGPGVVTILLGLGILSLEFERPRVWMARLKARGAVLRRRFEERRSSKSGDGR